MPERQRLEMIYDRYRHQYQETLHKLYKRVRKYLIKTDLNFNIKYRLKSFDSYYDKLGRMRSEDNEFTLLNDILGLRIVLPFLEDVQQVQQLMTNNFDIIEIEYKGAKNSYREFSYDSIHILADISGQHTGDTIPYMRKVCEIQIRTILQDAWAEVEHELIYKSDSRLPNDSIKRKMASLNASLTLSDIIFQEIRDYQKEMIQWRDNRHNNFLDQMENKSRITLVPNLKDTKVAKRKSEHIPLPKPKRPLEKDIFDALEAHNAREYKKSISLYSRILRNKLDPKIRAIIYNHRGMAFFAQSKYEKALKDFDKAVEFDPQNTNGFNNRGMAYRVLHNYAEALRNFSSSLEINSYQHETYHMRALTYFDIDDFTNALENTRMALEIKSDFEQAKHLKELITAKMGF